MAKRTTRKTKTEEAPVSKAVGARTKPENQERLDHILSRTKEEPGVASSTLAAELGITTLQCSQLADRLVNSGDIEVFKLANKQRTYYTPAALKRSLTRLERERDQELADREAAKTETSEAPAKPAAKRTRKTETSEAPAKSAAKRTRKTSAA